MKTTLKKLISSMVLLMSVGVAAQDVYLQCGTILLPETGKLQKEKTVIISGNRIKSIEDGFVSGNPEDKLIDLTTKTVMPGFIDMHVHIESESGPQSYIKKYTQNESDIAFEAVGYAGKTLMAGFTTVRDMGGTGVNIALRNAINKGLIDGPRIYTSGKSIATTGGHADPSNGSKKSLMGDPGPSDGVVNSPDDGKKAVRQRYKEGADVIKITATGGVLSIAKNGQNPQFTLEEIKAIAATAADYGMLTAAHAHGDEGMRRAILGGIKTIEHGTYMSDSTMELMKEHNAYLVPTISAGKKVAEMAEVPGFFPEIIAQKAREIGPVSQGTFAKAYKKGVPIVFGTDAGVFPHGQNAMEFRFMAEAGMPVLEAIASATVTAADLLGMGDSLGKLRAGYLADIIAVDEDPAKNVNTLEHVIFVMKDGKVYRQEGDLIK